MIINETNALSAILTVKNEEGKDIRIIFLNANLNTDLNSFSINATINEVSRDLLVVGATNIAGKTVAEQYLEFEIEVKRRAKEMGYILF
jgi:ssRNA-specific RNase YbeY (16S rRNA maturation enzyme)